jgi:hypothetical protein
MFASVRAFLHEIIDYAGLFPPAKLPLPEALAIYLHDKKTSPHRWMLGKFVCPAARLAELLPLARTYEDSGLLSLTVLGQQGSTTENFFVQLETALRAIEEFRLAWGTTQVVDSIEIPLPSQDEIDRAASYFGYAKEHLKQANLRGFLELPMSDTWQKDIARIAPRLHELHDAHDESQLGLKLRCGGVTAEAFPSDAQIASFIDQCRASSLPWKATAGLHHPRRHWDAGLQLWHHGFLNVFGASLLAQAQPLTQEDIVAILTDRAGQHFHFDEERFSWKEWACTTPQIAAFRACGPASFGSCSFVEPCGGLAALGLLETDGINS